jgi:alpha-beta hydrolase superfamily lysophospholipase
MMTSARLLRPLVAALLSAACSGDPFLAARPPPQEVRETPGMRREHGLVKSSDGTALFVQAWRPEARARAVVIVVHGLKDHSTRYDALAKALVEKGIAVHALDLKGHGRSAGARALVPSWPEHLADLDGMLARAVLRERTPVVFLFGHSMGGALVASYALTRKVDLAGVIISAGALKLDASQAQVDGAKLLDSIDEGSCVDPIDLDEFSRDPAVVEATRADPLVHDDCLPARTGLEMVRASRFIMLHAADFDAPLLALHGDADEATDPDGSRELVARARSRDKRLRIYPGLYHDLVHEPEAPRVIADIVSWVDKRAPKRAQ